MPHKDLAQRNAYHRAYYKSHKRVINDRVVKIHKRTRHERYEKIRLLKEAAPCKDCLQKYPFYVMDYDHRDPSLKVADVSSLVKWSSWEKVLNEIAKCGLVCSNCHRRRTYKGQNGYRTRRFEYHRSILDTLKESIPCLDCGNSFKACQMDFDHLRAKVANVARLVDSPTSVLLKELQKCHLVCSNCHRTRGFMGLRPKAPEHQKLLGSRFKELLESSTLPADRRHAPFPYPNLLGVVPDKVLAERTGISRAMVAWYRRKAGIKLDSRGLAAKRLDDVEMVAA